LWIRQEPEKDRMPLPREQLRRLAANLEAHEHRIAELHKQIKLIEDEIGAHQTMIDIGRNQRVLEKLGELHERPDLAKRIEGREAEEADEARISLPPGARTTVRQIDPHTVQVEMVTTSGEYSYRVIWNSQEGFSAAPSDPQTT
jgi:hypothetical protein